MAGLTIEFGEVVDSTEVDNNLWQAVNRIGFPTYETPEIPDDSRDIWSYRYYADPEYDRVVICDPINMELIGWIADTEHSHPGSADRAGYTDRMYVRTSGPSGGRLHTFDVVDARTRQLISKIHLPDPDDPTNESVGLVPRGCGTYNKYANLQVISHKLEPMATVINVNTDRPAAAAVGTKLTGTETIDANWDTNATGHSNWLDSLHFTLLDRYRDQILIYKIQENQGLRGTFTVTQTDTVQLPMCAHVIDEDVQDQTLLRNKYWAGIEGSTSKGIAPHIIEYDYDGNGKLVKGLTTIFPGILDTDQIHHYGYWKKYEELWVPLWVSKKTFVIDVAAGANNMTIKNGNGYDSGLGGAHVNFSDTLDLAVITNHFDRFITVIDRSGNVVNIDVTQNSDTTVPVIGYWRQSHINSISPDGNFFHLFSIQDGLFVEVDLRSLRVSRTLYTGGKPEQSSS